MEFMDVKSYAGRSNLPVGTIRKMCKTNILPSIKMGVKWRIDVLGADKVLQNMVQSRTNFHTITYSKQVKPIKNYLEMLKDL